MEMTMVVLSIASTKGGVGKTTLASALAVRAARESKRVAMVDLDPLGSLAAWWNRRPKAKVGYVPTIFTGADTASEAVEKLELDGWDWVFIDTPPAFVNTIEDAIDNATLVLIPLRPSSLDLIASEDAVVMSRDAGKPYLCIINDAEPRWKTTNSARDYLLAASVPVADHIIAHRQPYLGAMTSDRTGPEVERDNKCKEEIDGLWDEIKKTLVKNKSKERRRG
jgi:chromosome partitioning protein